ncbi:MAG: winged helix-turn-helix domain-containing protein [Anaerolineales bacterium]|jgi:DNA-binding MarR family transcriptional regulator
MTKDLAGQRELEKLEEIDPVIHSPTRLKVMTYLYLVENIDFVYLKRVTDLSWGNLSKHLTKLEEAGYVVMEKTFENKKPKTLIWLSDQGRQAFQQYKDNLQQIFEGLPD